MTFSRFVRYELRTTDVPAARSFYSDVLGRSFWADDVAVAQLPERAAALGAPAHWLGHISTADVEGAAGRIASSAGQPLGPALRGPDGSLRAVMRDPFGAVLALCADGAASRAESVVWHLHHSQDSERACAWYEGLFGWIRAGVLDLDAQSGPHQLFAWAEAEGPVGGMTNAASLPGVHPQWLFFFPVADINEAVSKIGARGGTAVPPVRIANGDVVAACEDPQKAAFGLYRFAR